MLKRIKQPMSEEQVALVAKGQKIIGDAETRLHTARADLAKLERLAKDAYKLGLIKGTEAMLKVSELAQIAGIIAQAEERLYRWHAEATAAAIGKGVDVPGPYAVLKAFQPDVTTMDGGGGR